MQGTSSVPDASWWCEELGVTTPLRLAPGAHRTWTRADFRDDVVSRSGVSLWQVGPTWSVTNHSRTMGTAFLYDLRFGRRRLAPQASLPLLRLRSWLLLPRSADTDRPHVVTLGIRARQPDRRDIPVARAPDDDSRQTVNPDEPSGQVLVDGLRAAERELRDPDVRNLVATYAWPYFAVSTALLEPASHRQVAMCLPGDEARGERALLRLRTAIWGRANRQPAEVVIRILVRHGLLTHPHVAAVRHDPRCGHTRDDLDPAARARLRGSGVR